MATPFHERLSPLARQPAGSGSRIGYSRQAPPESLGDILGKALADLGVPDGDAVQGRHARLRRLLDSDVLDHLMDTPKTEEAVQAWLNASSAESHRATQDLALAIAKELGVPKLVHRLVQEIGAIQA